MNAGVVSIGWWVPPGRRDAREIARVYGVSEDAVRGAGLESHAVAGPEDHPSTMAARATRCALEAAGLGVDAIDLLIFAGMTRDYPAPWVAAYGVLHDLGAKRAAGLDLGNRCPGLHDAMWIAATLIRAGTYRTVVVCTGDRFDALYGPPRKPVQVSDVFYSAGGAAVVLSPDAANDVVAFSHLTGPDHGLHSQNTPRAGGTRAPVAPRVPAELFTARNDISMTQLAQLRSFLSEADRHNIDAVKRAAGFDEIDLLVCAPLDVKGQVESIKRLGLSPEKTLFVLPKLGHMGPADSLVAFGLAIGGAHASARRIVMNSRSLTFSNALAIRANGSDAGIRVKGTPGTL